MYRNYLVVSSTLKTRELLAMALRSKGYTVTLANSGAEALLVVKNVAVDSALVDTVLIDMRSDTLKKKIEALRPECQVVLLTSFGSVKGTKEFLRFGEEDFLISRGELIEILRGAGSDGDDLPAPYVEKTKAALVEVIDVLVGLLELGDKYFGGSSHQAMRLARAVAEEMSSESDTMDEVTIASLLRDIGRAGVEEAVISQEGDLSEQQMREIQSHVESGVRLLEHIDFPWKVLPVIRHHHERYDGRGYPDGLKGREIPIGSRILTVVDAFLAMVSERPHRQARTQGAAFDELIRNAGTQFDPEVVEVFISMMEKRYPAETRRERCRILLADPNDDFRNLLKLRLVNNSYEVEAVGGVEEALDRILGERADLVLADIRPGKQEALQLIREMREDPNLRSIPFILLADRDDRVLKVRALRMGVDDFISKQVDLEEILARVENVLTRESLRRQSSTPQRHRGLAGRLENMGLPDILQTLHIGMKTALVTLTCGKINGKIWFEDGAVSHAKVEGVEGEEAFYTMLRWTEGDFVIEHGVRSRTRTISSDPMFLLMEGLRLMDEEKGSHQLSPPASS